MPDSSTVLIAAPDLLPGLKEQAGADGVEILAFTDADALRALATITKRRPAVVALERAFAATPRGAALINRIKADPALTRTEIRVVAYDVTQAKAAAPVIVPAPPTPPTEVAKLDAVGTRRAPRVRIAKGVELVVDGNSATLVDLSTVGAQVLSPTILKPNQRVRVILSDETGTWRVNGTIVWAAFEIPPRYRAGIEFLETDDSSAALQAFADRHQA